MFRNHHGINSFTLQPSAGSKEGPPQNLTKSPQVMVSMDAVSPASTLSTASFRGPETSKQPTYTTVGSVYNPHAVMPLQPPTRRPRTRRYPHAIRSPVGDGSFLPFPDELLSALSLKDKAATSPPTTAATLRQYSPLQQNNDRAVSPAAGQQKPGPTSMSVLSVRSGNLPSPSGLDSDGSVTSEDTLASSRITVKGLTNLASYPNPMQKAAQKALARARTAHLDPSRPSTPSSIPSSTADLAKDRLATTYGTTLTAAGPPQPLTAGPPGQRQFKPSTFEAAFRSFRVEDQVAQVPPTASLFQPTSPPTSPIGLRRKASTVFPSAFIHDATSRNSGRPAQVPSDARLHGPASPTSPNFAGFFRPLPKAAPPDNAEEEVRRKIQDTLPTEKAKRYFPGGFPPNYDGRHNPLSEDWETTHLTVAEKSVQKPISERTSEINKSFYAGTEGLVKSMEQIVRDHNYRRLADKVGVIGGERERRRGSHIERWGEDGKVQPPHLGIDEAKKMAESDHAKPFVNMAFAALLRYKDESESGPSAQNGWPSGFTEAEDAWVDSADEGNKSFFCMPREEHPRKKKVPRKSRRGY